MAASRLIRKNSSEGGGSTNNNNNNNNSGKTWRGESSSINLWNVRSYSAIQVPTACASMKIIPSNLPDAAVIPVSSNNTPAQKRSRRLSHPVSDPDNTPDVIQRISLKSTTTSTTTTTPQTHLNMDASTTPPPPSLKELRAQLGPVGRLIANAVEVGVTAAGSYLTGGMFGYMIGGVTNVPSFFQPLPPTTTLPKHNVFLPHKVQQRLVQLNSKAMSQAKSWAQLSAAFSGFHALTRVARGGVEDKWNNIIGSACTGAYLSRHQGPQAMLQSASSYAGITYLMDFMFHSTSNNSAGGDENHSRNGMNFKDTPISVEDRGY
jgi:hypothetical protein